MTFIITIFDLFITIFIYDQIWKSTKWNKMVDYLSESDTIILKLIMFFGIGFVINALLTILYLILMI